MEIRFYKPSDEAELLRIGHAFFEHNPYNEHSTLDDESLKVTLAHLALQHVLLVATVDDKVVGAAGAFITPLYWNFNQKMGVEAFWWVDPEHRAGGNGKKLRQALERVAKGRGATFWNMISLETSEPEKLHKMYAKAGFKHIENVYTKVL